jgi:hypothetical protein
MIEAAIKGTSWKNCREEPLMSWFRKLLSMFHGGMSLDTDTQRQSSPSPNDISADAEEFTTSTVVDYTCECGVTGTFDLRQFTLPGGQNGLHVMCQRCEAVLLVPPAVLSQTNDLSRPNSLTLVKNWRNHIKFIRPGGKGLESKQFGTFHFSIVPIGPSRKELIYDAITDLALYQGVKVSINIPIWDPAPSTNSHDVFYKILALAEKNTDRLLSIEPEIKERTLPTAKKAVKEKIGTEWSGANTDLIHALNLTNLFFSEDGTICLRYRSSLPCKYCINVELDKNMSVTKVTRND